MECFKSRGGASSVEVLLGIVIIAMASVAAFGLLATTLAAATVREQTDRAQLVAEEGLEAVKQIRGVDFQSLLPGTFGLARVGGSWAFSGSEDTSDGLYRRRVTVATVDDDTRDVSVVVDWTAGGRNHSLRRDARLTDWYALEAFGNWGTPVIVGSIDLGPNAEGTGTALRGNYLYVSASISAQNKPSFFIADITDPTQPLIPGSYISGKTYYDVDDVPDTNVVYAVGTKADQELFVFDTAAPALPVVTRTIDLDAIGYLAQVHGNWLYVGVANGIKIFDITVPASPVLKKSLTLGADAVDLAIRGNYAYVATNADESEIKILDVTDPANASEAGSVNVPTTKDALSVSIRGLRMFVGTASGTGSELYRYDLTNPTSPSLSVSTEFSGDLNSIIAAGPYLFTANNVSNNEFVIERVAGSGQPTLEAQLNMSQVATDLDFVDNTIYIVLRSNDALQIIQPAP
jgi:hypothetical protein